MADDKDLNLEGEVVEDEADQADQQPNKVDGSRVEKRIKDLSDKVRLTAEERDELKNISEEKDKENANLKKELEFSNSFGDSLAKFPEAASYKDVIKKKVLQGYSMEDAITTTLISEDKYTPPKSDKVQSESPAGGKAATTRPDTGGEKPISEMTREEKRAKLVEAEKAGLLSVS